MRSGRVWYTARIRAADNPAFCKKGSTHPSAKAFPIDTSERQLAVYEPKSGKYIFVDTCFSTHHLQFAEDANDTLWTSGGSRGRGLARHQEIRFRPAMRRHPRAGRRWCSTPTATANSIRGLNPGKRRGPEARSAAGGQHLCRHAESRRRQRLGIGGISLSRRNCPVRSANPAQRDLQCACARLRRTRRRHRPSRRGLGVPRQRTSGGIRPAQMQECAQRSERRPATTAPKAGASIACRGRDS